MGVEAKTTTFEVGQIDPFLTFAMARSALASAGSGDKSDSHAQARHRPGDVAAKVSPVIRLRNVTIEYDHHPAVHPSSEWRLRGGQHDGDCRPEWSREVHVAQSVDRRIDIDLRVDRARVPRNLSPDVSAQRR